MTGSSHEAATSIIRTLKQHGHLALLAGGCVRDHLLGLEPSDYDVATSARPEEVQAIFPRSVAVGVQFGVVRVVDADGEHTTEVATFRSDGAYVDGRRPTTVHFSGPEEDAARRDFTINGMFMDPTTGEVIDHVGGREDLRRKVVHAIGEPEARLREDRLRLLRAIRFAARFGFAIEPRTEASIRALAPLIASVSAERIGEEIGKMLLGPRPRDAFERLAETGLLREILPEVDAMRGVEQPPEYHPEGDVFTHVMIMLDHLPPERSLELALAVLLHDVGKPPTMTRTDRIRFNGHADVGAEMSREVCERLRLSRRTTERVVDLVRHHMTFAQVQEMRASRLRRFLGMEHFDEHLALHRMDCLSAGRSLENWQLCRERLAAYGDETPLPPPLVTGHDLIALGLAPGPPVGSVLEAVRDRQLEGELTDRDAALAFARALIAARSTTRSPSSEAGRQTPPGASPPSSS